MLPNNQTSWLTIAIIIILASISTFILRSGEIKEPQLIVAQDGTKNLNTANVVTDSGYPVDYCDLDVVVCIGEENTNKQIKWYAQTTAYTKTDTCPDSDCIMANGEKAYLGAAACPRIIPLGTNILIDGMEYTCTDRTSQKYDGRFDMWYGYTEEAYRHAKQYGIKNSEIIIL